MGSIKGERGLRVAALVVGVLLTLMGLVGILAYAVGAVHVLVEGPADRSWLFWGLSLAGIGAALLIGGVALLVVGWRRLDRPPDSVH